MTIFDGLTLIGGLCLFLFGMDIMGKALERRAGDKLQSLLSKLTTNKFAGLLTGLGVTSIIQSSSATTVMVVGFVNSGIMTLKQAINVIMGANIGTTVTAWILSLGGIEGDNLFMQLLKPMSFTPILALIGIIFQMFSKNDKKKDTGMILLGFAVLMFGMDAMTDSVAGLEHVPAFRNIFLMFKNPILAVLAGAILTAIIQSSSASVGILQALSATGAVSYGAAIPIIMGQNIGTCITALLSSFGTNKNAKRTALVHLSFNVIGTIVWLTVFTIVSLTIKPALFDEAATHSGIAVAHSAFNIMCTLLLLPMSSLLEKIVYKLVPETKQPDEIEELDERLLATPAFALERCHALTAEMGRCSIQALKDSMVCLKNYSPKLMEEIKELEDKTDHYEDIISTYLVKLSTCQLEQKDSTEAAKLLKIIGDFERIADHSVNIAGSGKELSDKQLSLSEGASAELTVLCNAVDEIIALAFTAFADNNTSAALSVEPLEQVIDRLKEVMRSNHIARLQQGGCSIEGGFIWSDLLTNLERTSDHCSNIAISIIDYSDMNVHSSLHELKSDSSGYKEKYAAYAEKYLTFDKL
ncbi:MAG: Na/Pi cotransporter family protein [Oscillospiraceae bacterium]|nr:Na/Pi cotransporter family protein [Oscillospiraceae bacterium]